MSAKSVAWVVGLIVLFLSGSIFAAEDPRDTYYYQLECPENGASYAANNTADEYKFIRCQCVSYVADQLSRLFTERYWEHRGQDDIMTKFMNDQYYMPQTYVAGGVTKTVASWSHAVNWRNIALRAEIGVTGARDNFVWDEASYNAVFRGDVAWWDKWSGNDYGHVAFVESAEPDVYGRGAACVTVSEYNWSSKHSFSYRKICKNAPGHEFPNAFLHIDQDHAYCINHPDAGSCPRLFGKQTASSDGKGDGIGGGSDFFNLRSNNFYSVDALGNVLDSDTYRLTPGQTITVKVQVKAVKGDTRDHMRDGKDTIEVDLYQRSGFGDWTFLKRGYIQVTNLSSGATHTEGVTFTVPNTNQEPLSFKAKIDAEDEAMEANEGDNWTPVETFDVNQDPRFVDFVSSSLQFRGSTPFYAGDPIRLGAWITNQGTLASPTGIRSSYSVECPGTGRVYLTDDGTDANQLGPGMSAWEEILNPVTLPNVPGTCTAYFCTDYQGAVGESNETNNCSTLGFTLQPRPKPKLTIVKFQDQRGCCTTNTGEYLYPDIWIRNDGPVAPGANVLVLYQVSSPIGTGGAYWNIGYGTISPSELPPGGTDEDYMDAGRWQIPKSSAWKNQWHTVRACVNPEGNTPTGGGSDICTVYQRYSKK